jgi:hypothetical protein
VSQRDEDAATASSEALKMGWALVERTKAVRFTEKQKNFMMEKFDEGIRNSRKYDPRVVAQQMREHPNFPAKTDWLTAAQIQSFWSRMAADREKSMARRPTGAAAAEDEFDEDETGTDHIAQQIMVEHIYESINSVLSQISETEN